MSKNEFKNRVKVIGISGAGITADCHSVEAARESMLRLIEVSDVIVPGHGVPFMKYRPEWAKLGSQ